MSEEMVAVETAGGVRTVIMTRAKARNALSLAMMGRLEEAIQNAAADPETKVVVLAAEGPAFCAGHDLKELRENEGDRAFMEKTFDACARLMLAIVRCPKPVIAKVHAMATAAGCQLVASCDLAVASAEARFATPGVNIGLFCSTPMVALSRNIGRKKAMEMLLTGLPVDAVEAERLGLVNTVTEPDSLDEAVAGMAAVIAEKSPLTLKIGKEAFYRQAEMPLDEAYRLTARVMTENMMARDAQEGIDAFLSKRPPHWTGQ